MKRLILLSTFLLLLIGCPLLPTSYDPLEQGIEPWMRSQWHTAQNELSQLVPIPHDPRRRRGVFDISIDRFTFRKSRTSSSVARLPPTAASTRVAG